MTFLGGARRTFVKEFLFPFGDRMQGFGARSKQSLLMESEKWPADKLEAYRVNALQKLITTAYHEVPYYQSTMKALGLRPENFQTLQDISRLPILTKQIIRENYPQNLTRDSGRRTYEVSSSGSTGTNLVVREDTDTTGILYASHLYALHLSGWNMGDQHLQFGMTMNRSFFKRMKDLALGCTYVSAAELRDAELDEVLRQIVDKRIKHVHGYAGSLFALARRASEANQKIQLSAVVSWGDNLYPHYRKQIETSFNTKVFDSYGCAEGITVSAQCGVGNTYHLYSPFVHVEVLNDKDEPCQPGEMGHLILTRLQAGAMPLIRYRVGDMGILGEQRPCPCGRTHPTMEAIQGRDTDFIVTPDGNRLIVHFFTGLLEYFHEVKHFQVIQREKAKILIRLVPWTTIDQGVLDRLERTLLEKGANLQIQFEVTNHIPTAKSGKRRFVINEMGSDARL